MAILREPLVHFLALGALLFIIYGFLGGDEERQNEIIVSEGTVDHLIELWIRTRQRPPTRQELRGIIDDYVIEEILYREGKALGLDQDDTIIRRRLRQKMEFLADDVADLKEPAEEELQAFLDENPDRFRVDSRLTFEHIFFNVDRRGETSLDDAVSTRDRLVAGYDGDPRELGDGIPLPFKLEASSTREIASMFGLDFAQGVVELPIGEWAGPVQSGYGLHIVRISEYVPGRAPELTEVREFVVREWSAQRRVEVKNQFYDSFKERYKITIETSADVEERLSGSETGPEPDVEADAGEADAG